MVDGTMYLLIYSLLPGNDQHIYIRLLTTPQELCQQHNITFRPTTMFLDYEVAIRNATYTVFPGISIKDCFFPLFSMYLEKRIEAWLIDSLQRKRHPPTSSKRGSLTTTSTQHDRGLLVQRTRRHQRHRHQLQLLASQTTLPVTE